MVQANPYAAPASELIVNEDVEFGDVAVFSLKSRIGRLRYLARVTLFTIASYFALGLLVGVSVLGGTQEPSLGVGALLGYVLFFIGSVVLGLMFAAQRLHDMNHSGWISLLMFLPIVNVALGLYLIFGRGTSGANDYGAPPPPNPLGVKLAGLILPVIFIIAVLAAIAIPAYQQYAIRAQQAEQVQFGVD